MKIKLLPILKTACLMLFICLLNTNAYAVNMIKNVRTGNQGEDIRIVVDGTEKFNYDAFLLDSPQRLVIDVNNASVSGNPSVKSGKVVASLRLGDLPKNKGKRLVFNLNSHANIKKKFILEPQKGQTNWRLVIDLTTQGFTQSASTSKTTTGVSPTVGYSTHRKKIVVLDPGHGGKDPGAIGPYYKTYEKNITLAAGRELRQVLEKRGFKVYMTRSTDVFIPLRNRVSIARGYHADLFISLHADSTVNRKAQGLSIYTLSETASDKEAAALAERENKADIIDGMDFSDNSPEINDVLISLSQNDSRNKSSKFAAYVVNDIKHSIKTVTNPHKFAGFAVLKAPDIPSVLVEMGYVSNYTEETNLRTPAYRKKIVESIGRAVTSYFKDPEISSF